MGKYFTIMLIVVFSFCSFVDAAERPSGANAKYKCNDFIGSTATSLKALKITGDGNTDINDGTPNQYDLKNGDWAEISQISGAEVLTAIYVFYSEGTDVESTSGNPYEVIRPVDFVNHNKGVWKRTLSSGDMKDRNFSGSVTVEAAYTLNNIKHSTYGAIGNGSTDDTAAFAAMESSAYKEIIIPEGTYIVSWWALSSDRIYRGAGKGKTIIKRKDADTDGFFVAATAQTGIEIHDLTFDGNEVNQTNAGYNLLFNGCGDITVDNVSSINGEGTIGIGIYFKDGVDDTNGTTSNIRNCEIYDNDAQGILIAESYYVTIDNCLIKNNDDDGILIQNLQYPPDDHVHDYFTIKNNKIFTNGSDGLGVIGFYTGGSALAPITGHTTPPARGCLIAQNKIISNTKYGLVYQSRTGVIQGNHIAFNGDSAANGGVLFNAWDSIINGNTIEDNYAYGIDAGGAVKCIISDNVIVDQGKTSSANAVGVNVSASQHCKVSGNIFEDNGTTANSKAIVFGGYDSSGSGGYLETIGKYLTISDNTIELANSSVYGIFAKTGSNHLSLNNNIVQGGADGNGFVLYGGESQFLIQQSNNVDWTNGGPGDTIASASNLILPDVGSTFTISGTATITNIRTVSYHTFYQKVRTIVITNAGSGYDPDSVPTVNFSGGGGTGAAGTALVSNSGYVIGVEITNSGSGYTSAPTVTFGSGAAAGTAVVGCDNFQDREIRLVFTASLTVSDGSNLDLAGDFSATADDVMVLIGSGGDWKEISRSNN